ncbi:beta-propeller fold lactonase family protein [Leptospira kobayashii]|uniref:beta-propeller fold lactonase family protein n=1 Tax=Leptospira kobayashii TaxID=1917830 RepID=UPI00143544C5|nr:beta-propeller fold lactonase family protein [Leptospira kobayashii]
MIKDAELVEAEVPQFLALLYLKSGPNEVGIKVWNVDPDTGKLTSTIGMQAIPPNAPGNSPVNLKRVPKSRELFASSGFGSPSTFNKIYSFKIQDDGSVTVIGSSPSGILPNTVTPNISGTNVYATITSSTTNVYLYQKDTSGNLTQSTLSSYPFGTYCSPSSLLVSQTERNIFITNPSYLSIYQQDTSAGTVTIGSGSPLPIAASPTLNDNLTLHPTRNYIYTTIANIAAPIAGFIYNQDSTASAIQGSPFTPSGSYSATTSSTKTLTIDPYGRFIAFVYSDASGNRLQLLKINSSTGALTPSGFPIGVGNAPGDLTWDESGRFIYFFSDTGAASSEKQLEVYKVSSTGELTSTPGSPVILGTISSFSPRGIVSVTKTMKVKPGEYP